MSEDLVWQALRDVNDPELPISLVDLGLIYDVRITAEDGVELDVTFTAMGCPCMEFITQDIRTRLLLEPCIEQVEINVVWDPPWTKDRLSDMARMQLRTFGVSV